ncbi:MAG: hypothetical protein Q4F28_06380 [Eubacteriales bacterium]|nr:hypothetical protein [Eubacteriales bacterium]
MADRRRAEGDGAESAATERVTAGDVVAEDVATEDAMAAMSGTDAPVSVDSEETLSELELENRRLREENERLKAYRASLPPKERMYDHVNLTVKQMDIIIGILLTVLAVVVVMGLLDR